MAGIQTDQGPLLGQAPMLLEQVLEEQMGRLESIMSSLLLTPLLVLVLGPRAELHPIDRSWVAVPPLKLDASLIHVDRADARGVCQIAGPDHYMDDLFARAAEQTFVSCDELVDTGFFKDPAQSRLVYWERAATTGVVHMPGGAHPSSCNPLYGFDVAHFKEYAASAKDEAGFSGYRDKFLAGSESDYQAAVGGLDAIRQLPLPTY